MMKWTMSMGWLMALACSGVLSDLPSPQSPPSPTDAHEGGSSAAPIPEPSAVSTGAEVPAVEATLPVQRICRHDSVVDMIETWGQRASTPAGATRLCQARYMSWKEDLDDINPAIAEGLFETLADCLDAGQDEWHSCYGTFFEALQAKMGRLPPMPGPSPEEIAALQGPEKLREGCVVLSQQWAEAGVTHQPERLTACVGDNAKSVEMIEMLLGKEEADALQDALIQCLKTAVPEAPLSGSPDPALRACTQQVVEDALSDMDGRIPRLEDLLPD